MPGWDCVGDSHPKGTLLISVVCVLANERVDCVLYM